MNAPDPEPINYVREGSARHRELIESEQAGTIVLAPWRIDPQGQRWLQAIPRSFPKEIKAVPPEDHSEARCDTT